MKMLRLALVLLSGVCVGGCDGDGDNQCGDDVVQSPETCDGSAVGGHDCTTIGEEFVGGILACNASCNGWDTSLCTPPSCGDWLLASGELCDGPELDGQDCESIGQGFTGGNLGCNDACDGWDTSQCLAEVCGDGHIDTDEVCDGSDLDGQDCTSLGLSFVTGTLGCSPTCDGWDTSGCLANLCGDGQLDPGETCDGSDFGTADCATLSTAFDGGTLGCDGACQLLTQGCTGDTRLTNLPSGCTDAGYIHPNAGEEAHWVAARLTPAVYPFTVHRIEYRLGNEPVDPVVCDASLAHQVAVFADTTTPSASPVIHETLQVPSAVLVGAHRYVGLDLTTPLTLQAGEHLYIAVQNAGTYPNVTCLETCGDAGAEADRAWWGSSDSAPFPWATLSSFGIDVTLWADALGTP